MAHKKLAKAITDKVLSKRASLSDLNQAIMHEFGGVEGFARKLRTEFDKAPTGGSTRARLLDGSMRLMAAVEKQGGAPNLDDLTDEELAELQMELANSLEDDGQETTTKPPAQDQTAT